jgi:multidrug efflux pump subunit AcrB
MFKGLIKRPIAVVMVLIAVLVLGIAAIRMLPVSLVPDIDIPQITVQVTSPNKSARELNETMMTQLRSQLVQVAHLNDIVCETKDGSGHITMTFDYGADADYIFIDVNERIDRTMNGWPRDEERPTVIRASATDIPAFYVNITLAQEDVDFKPDDINTVSPKFIEMSDFSRQVIVRRLEQLSEVAMVDITGQVFPELLIVPDMNKLQSMGLSEDDLSAAIQNANVRLGNLTIRDGEYRFNVRFESTILTREDVENVYIKLSGRVYQIKDLAEVHEHPQVRKGMVLSGGKQAISLAVIKRSESKMADLKKSVDVLMNAFQKDYPNLRFEVTRDQTELLDYSINNMVSNLIWGGLFACIIIFFFMRDFRSPILIVITIPLALILSFLFFFVLKITINIISLSGLVLGLGMMVDNSIIVIDNITRMWNTGEKLEVACVRGAREVFAPMLSSVLTTCAIFVPLIFLSGISGALFYDQAMAVSITLFSALIVSVVVIPVFYYQLYRKQPCFMPNRFIQKIGVGDMIVRYDSILSWFFRHRVVMWSVFGVSVLFSAVLFLDLDKRKLPELSHSDTLVKIEWNSRVTAEENSRRCQMVVDHFSDLIQQSTVMSGAQQFVLSHTDETGVSEAIIYIKTGSTADIEKIESGVGDYIRSLWPQAVYSFKASGNLFDMIFSEKEASLVAKLRSVDGKTPDPSMLSELLSAINRDIPEANIQPAEWNEHIELVAKPEMLALYGVSYNQLLSYLQQSLNDNSVLRVSKGSISVPVVIGENKSDIKDLIQNNYIYQNNGSRVPLEVLLRETHNRDLKKITSGEEGEYYRIDMDVKGGKNVRSVMESIKTLVRDDGRFEVDFSGSYFTNREMIKELCMVLLISVLLLFFILAAQFESLIQPVIILSELITDIFAALLVLWICGESLNLMSMIGIVVMCGIVINDSILKVDTINRLRAEGMGLKHAILEAGSRRLKAILMTSLTTILAIAPFLVRGNMGSDLQYPLSLTLISGMVVGTFVSVFFIPIAYYVIEKNRGRKK